MKLKVAVTQWRDNIIDGLNLNPKPLWNEDLDVTPYYTDKPDWDALSALLLYIAAKYSAKEVPATIEKMIECLRTSYCKRFSGNKGISS